MYDKRAKQDALDLWFSMPGEMSVDDFAAELGYPSGSTLRNWIKADPRHDPDKCQYRSKPVLPKLEAIRRVAEGATAAQAARETGLTPQQVRYSVGRYARGGTAALLPAPARKRRKGEAVDEGKTRRASRPARPMPCEQPPGLPEELPDDPAALKAIIADLELSNAALREVLAVLKAGAPALTNAEAAGCASRLEGAFGAAAACAALGLARSTYYYQLDALTSPSAPPDGTAGEVERAFRVDGNSSRGYRFVREVVSRRRGRPVSEKVVRRLMRGLGLRVCYARRGRYSSYAGEIDAPAPVSATAKSAERATLSRRRRPRFPAGGATALWPPALPRAAAQGALDRGVVEVRGPDLNLQRRGALGVPGRDRPARDLPSAELREPDRHRDVLCAERGQPPRGVRGPHDCPLSGSPSPSAASASRSFMR